MKKLTGLVIVFAIVLAVLSPASAQDGPSRKPCNYDPNRTQPFKTTYVNEKLPLFSQFYDESWGTAWCAPTAAGIAFAYWAENGFPALLTDTNGNTMYEQEEKYAGVNVLGNMMGTNVDAGNTDDEVLAGIRSYLESAGALQDFVIRVYDADEGTTDPIFEDYAFELESGGAVLVGLEWENGGHWLVGRAVSRIKNDEGTHYVNFIDPGTGRSYNTRMKPSGAVWYNRQWVTFDIMIVVVPTEMPMLVATAIAGATLIMPPTSTPDAGAAPTEILSLPTESLPVDEGDRIVFQSDRDGENEVFTVNADGSDLRQLTFNEVYDGAPAWSPDKTKIAFGGTGQHNGYNDDEVFVMNADGSNVQNLTNSPGVDWSPAWSPDGQQIVFHSDRDGDYDIYIMDADGSNLRQLTFNSAADWHPNWSPDGSTIVYASDIDGDYDIYTVSVDGGQPIQITYNNQTDAWPMWSPDGTQIACESSNTVDGGFQVLVMDADGSGIFQVTSATDHENWHPSWSPDGTRIVFASNKDGNFDIWTINVDGTNRQRITYNTSEENWPDW
ncbi:MAG: PD40 domain-containing protein [Anaerolineae bacterium]|nr:PD40 domain-containing protein [Anaerolineae bacterium]